MFKFTAKNLGFPDLMPAISGGFLRNVVHALNTSNASCGSMGPKDVPTGPELGLVDLMATRWSSEGTPALLFPQAVRSYATGINDAGDVIGVRTLSLDDELGDGFLLRNGEIISLNPILGTYSSHPTDINNAGVIVGFAFDTKNGKQKAFIYDSKNGPFQFIDKVPGTTHDRHSAAAINDVGQVVGVSFSGNKPDLQTTRGFLFSNNVVRDLGMGLATDINANGMIVGLVNGTVATANASNPDSILQKHTHFDGVYGFSIASAVNSKGNFVGNYSTDSSQQAFLFIEDDVIDITVNNQPYETAVGINDLDHIAVNGNNRAAIVVPHKIPPGINIPSRDFQAVLQILFGITGDGGGLAIRPSGGPVPIDPWGPLQESTKDILRSLAISELGSMCHDKAIQKKFQEVGTSSIMEIIRHARVP